MAEGANTDQDNGLMVSLRKRKQALEESLHLKTLQLKSLCLKEAVIIVACWGSIGLINVYVCASSILFNTGNDRRVTTGDTA